MRLNDTEREHVGVGAHVYAMRRKAGLSLRECARRADLSPSHLSLVERARGRLSADAMERVCRVCGVEFDDFLCGSGPSAMLAERAADPCGLAELLRVTYDIEDLSGVVDLVRRWRMEAL